MTRINFFSLLFLFAGLALNAQNKLSGKLINSEKKGISYANVLLKKGDSIIQYSTTGNQGRFSIENIKPGKYNFSIKTLGYESYNDQVNFSKNNQNKTLGTIVLEKKAEQLDEVFIEQDRPIEVRGDTVAVTMEYFRDSTEQNVEELLRQVPGLNIDRSGTIKVGNREIEKIMVEGGDFFGKGYKVLSKNMPAYPVNEVQIIKNYTENRLLKGLSESGKIALNLGVDKKYKRKWFGNIKAGAGTNEFYKAKANLMNFGKKAKYYLLTGLNNTGTDVTGDLNKLTRDQNSGIANSVKAPQFLSLPDQEIYLRDARTNFNKARLVSVNAIFNPTDSLEIKPTLLFNADQNNFFNSQMERTDAGGSNFTNKTTYDLNKKKRVAFGKLEITHDLSKDEVIESKTRYNRGDFRNKSQLNFNDIPTLEKNDRDNNRFDQALTYTNRLKAKKLFRISARYIHEKNTEDYKINRFYYKNLFPSYPDTDKIKQTAHSTVDFAGINASFRKNTFNGNKLKLKLGYKYLKNNINSRFALLKNDSLLTRPKGYQNKTSFQRGDLYLNGNYKFTFSDFSLVGELEFHQLFNQLQDSELDESQNPFFINPEISLNWSINNKNSLNLLYSYQSQNPGINNSYPNYLLTGYRTFSKGTGELNLLHSSQWSLNYRLGNWTDRFFTTVSAFYNYDYDFISSNKIISQNYNRSGKIVLKDKALFGIVTKANYFLSSLSSNIRANFNFTQADFKNRINGLGTRSVVSNNYSYGLKFKSAFDGIFDFTLGSNWQTSTIKTANEFSYTNNTTYLNLSFTFNSRFNIDFSATQYHLGKVDKKSDYYFMDFSTNYKLIKDKLTIGLQGKNLFDTKEFTRYSISDIGSTTTTYRLLPRMLLFDVEYRF